MVFLSFYCHLSGFFIDLGQNNTIKDIFRTIIVLFSVILWSGRILFVIFHYFFPFIFFSIALIRPGGSFALCLAVICFGAGAALGLALVVCCGISFIYITKEKKILLYLFFTVVIRQFHLHLLLLHLLQIHLHYVHVGLPLNY